jgi:hypothetical protein
MRVEGRLIRATFERVNAVEEAFYDRAPLRCNARPSSSR